MRVSQEFFSYRSGVYRCPVSTRSQRNDNYHSVRIVGWNEEVQQGRLVKYWVSIAFKQYYFSVQLKIELTFIVNKEVAPVRNWGPLQK